MLQLLNLPIDQDREQRARYRKWQGIAAALDRSARDLDRRCLEEVGHRIVDPAAHQARMISEDKRILFNYTGSATSSSTSNPLLIIRKYCCPDNDPDPETKWTETALSMLCKIYVEDSRKQLKNEGVIRGQPRDQFLSLVIFCGYKFPDDAEVELMMIQSLVSQILELCGYDFFDKDDWCAGKFSTTSDVDHWWFVVKRLVQKLSRQMTVICYIDNPAALPIEIFDSFILGELVALYKEQTELAKNEEKAQFLIVATDPSESGDFRISEAVNKMGLKVEAHSYFESTDSAASLGHSRTVGSR